MCFWPCCNRVMMVITHLRWTTSQGVGNVSRLDPRDGSTRWTYNLGDHNGNTNHPRIPGRVKIDEEGNVYVAWQVQKLLGDIAPSGGVTKLNKNGGLIWQVEFPNTSEFESFAVQPPLLVIDPTDENNVYATSLKYNAAQQMVHKLDGESGGIVLSLAPTLPPATISKSIAGLAMDSVGEFHVIPALSTSSVFFTKFRSDGTIVYDWSMVSWLPSVFSVNRMAAACDANTHALIFGSPNSGVVSFPLFNKLLSAQPAAGLSNPLSWSKSLANFLPPETGMFFGSWQLPAPEIVWDIVHTGSRVIFGTSTATFRETTSAGIPLNLYGYNLWGLDPGDGSRIFNEKIPENSRSVRPVRSMAYDSTSGILLVAMDGGNDAPVNGEQRGNPVLRLTAGLGEIWTVNPCLSGTISCRGCDVRTV